MYCSSNSGGVEGMIFCDYEKTAGIAEVTNKNGNILSFNLI